MNEPKSKTLWNNWIKPLLIVITIMVPFRSSIADWNDVPTGSMQPTILVGDRILVNKLAYDLKIPFSTRHIARWSDPQRGDIVVCFSPVDRTRLVKRVVATPGDTVAMENNHLIINGQKASYRKLTHKETRTLPHVWTDSHLLLSETSRNHSHPLMLTPGSTGPHSFTQVTLPPGQYVLMGDNRDNSFDSRFFGFVDRSQIVGRSRRVVASLDHNNFFLPRRDRWFKTLP